MSKFFKVYSGPGYPIDPALEQERMNFVPDIIPDVISVTQKCTIADFQKVAGTLGWPEIPAHIKDKLMHEAKEVRQRGWFYVDSEVQTFSA